MSAKTSRIIRELTESVKKASTPRTQPYDTQATVTRIEGGVAWVHIPGGVDETPVKLTINAAVGDTVQVRVSGGRAFLVGNSTAPPTDDKLAKTVQKDLGVTNKLVSAVKKVAERASKIATSMNQYFWVSESGTSDNGVHITQVPQEDFQADPESGGGNLLATSNGIAVRDGLTELATFGATESRIGDVDSRHVVVGVDGVDVMDGNDLLMRLGFDPSSYVPMIHFGADEAKITGLIDEADYFSEIDMRAECPEGSDHPERGGRAFIRCIGGNGYTNSQGIKLYAKDNDSGKEAEINVEVEYFTHDSKIELKADNIVDGDGTPLARLVVESKSLSSVTLSASGGTDTATGDVSKTGYTPICIVAISKSGSGSGQAALSGYYISGTTANVSYVNVSTAARTVGTTVTVLYMKS